MNYSVARSTDFNTSSSAPATSKTHDDNVSVSTSKSVPVTSSQGKKQRSNKERIKSRIERRKRRDRSVNIQVYSVTSGDDMASPCTTNNKNDNAAKENEGDTSSVMTAATAALTEVSSCLTTSNSDANTDSKDVFSMAVDFLLPSPTSPITPVGNKNAPMNSSTRYGNDLATAVTPSPPTTSENVSRYNRENNNVIMNANNAKKGETLISNDNKEGTLDESSEDFMSPMARMRIKKKNEVAESPGKDVINNDEVGRLAQYHNEEASVGSNSTEKTRNSPTKRRNLTNKKKSLVQINDYSNQNNAQSDIKNNNSYLKECAGADTLVQMGGLPDMLRNMFSGNINLNTATCGTITMGNGLDDDAFLDEDDESDYFSEDEESLYSDEEDDSAYYDTENDDHTHASTISEGSESSQSTLNSKQQQHSGSADTSSAASNTVDGMGRSTDQQQQMLRQSQEQNEGVSRQSKSINSFKKGADNEYQSSHIDRDSVAMASKKSSLQDESEPTSQVEQAYSQESLESESKRNKASQNNEASNKKKNNTKNTDIYDDPQFVEHFIEEMIQEGVLLTWHKAQAAQYYERPKQVTASLELGKVVNGAFAEPKLSWQVDPDANSSIISGGTSTDASSSNHMDNLHQVELFDIVSFEKAGAMNFHSYPFAIPSNSFFISLSNGSSILMEAKDPDEQLRIISGMSKMMSRLSYNLIAGDIDVCWDLFACSDCMDADNISPENLTVEELDLWFISKAMNDVTHRLVEKSTNLATSSSEDEEEV